MGDLFEVEPLASPVDFATYLRRSLSAADTATALDRLSAASREIRKYCRWHLWPLRVDELTLDGNGARELLLPTVRVSEIATVTESGVELVDGTDFEWSADGLLRRLAGLSWPRAYRSIVVELTHGYDDDPDAPAESSGAPPDLRDMACGVAARGFDSPAGRIREVAGAVGVTYPQTSPSVAGGVVLVRGERHQLDQYRIKAP